MTKSQLDLATEIDNKIQPLKEQRKNYLSVFEYYAEQKEKENVSILLSKTHCFQEPNFQSTFPRLEILKLYEYRIKQLDVLIAELEQKFEQL